jgi:thiol-disulfide isomerase/thioredoxin
MARSTAASSSWASVWRGAGSSVGVPFLLAAVLVLGASPGHAAAQWDAGGGGLTAPHRQPDGGPQPQEVEVVRAEVVGEADFRWRLRALDGSPTSLEAFRGQVLFINMWATWCGPCVQELASIQALVESMKDSGVAFLLVSPEDPEPVQRFLRVHGYDLPVYLEVQEMPPAFGLRALPTTFVVDRQGQIVLRHRGAADWDQDAVRRFLQALGEG